MQSERVEAVVTFREHTEAGLTRALLLQSIFERNARSIGAMEELSLDDIDQIERDREPMSALTHEWTCLLSMARRTASAEAQVENLLSIVDELSHRFALDAVHSSVELDAELAQMAGADAMIERVRARALDAVAEERKKREPGCHCHQEEGDSPCPVHPSADDGFAWTDHHSHSVAVRGPVTP